MAKKPKTTDQIIADEIARRDKVSFTGVNDAAKKRRRSAAANVKKQKAKTAVFKGLANVARNRDALLTKVGLKKQKKAN